MNYKNGTYLSAIESIRDPFEDLRRKLKSIRDPFEDLRRKLKSIRDPFEDLRRTQAAIESAMKSVDVLSCPKFAIESAMKPALDWQKQVDLIEVTQASLGFSDIIKSGLSANSFRISTPTQRRTPLFDSPSTASTGEVYEEISPEIIPTPSPELVPITNHEKVFIKGTPHEEFNNAVARFVKQLGFNAILLDELPNGGRTRIEKLESYTNVDFAIVLLTSDHVGAQNDELDGLKAQACQDAIFILGYFVAELKRPGVCPLSIGDLDLPPILAGWDPVRVDSDNGWKLKLAQEMKEAGLPVDVNKLL